MSEYSSICSLCCQEFNLAGFIHLHFPPVLINHLMLIYWCFEPSQPLGSYNGVCLKELTACDSGLACDLMVVFHSGMTFAVEVWALHIENRPTLLPLLSWQALISPHCNKNSGRWCVECKGCFACLLACLLYRQAWPNCRRFFYFSLRTVIRFLDGIRRRDFRREGERGGREIGWWVELMTEEGSGGGVPNWWWW